jgi:hypothetical protein
MPKAVVIYEMISNEAFGGWLRTAQAEQKKGKVV